MAQRILTLRKIKEILRMKWVLGLSDRQVAASLKIAHSTVGEYLKRAEQSRAGLEASPGTGRGRVESQAVPAQTIRSQEDVPNPTGKKSPKN